MEVIKVKSDGQVYQNLVDGGFLKHRWNITFNADGIPFFRSSAFSFWPLHLIVNELPYGMRYGIHKCILVCINGNHMVIESNEINLVA